MSPVRSAYSQAFTDLEIAILGALANGLQSKEIATSVCRSTATVEFYVRTLYLKLEARSRAHLVAKALIFGIVQAENVRLENRVGAT